MAVVLADGTDDFVSSGLQKTITVYIQFWSIHCGDQDYITLCVEFQIPRALRLEFLRTLKLKG